MAHKRLTFLLLALLAFVSGISSVKAAYEICGSASDDDTFEDDQLTENIDRRATRLMALRSPHSGWENTPEAVTAMLLTSPAKFSNMENTLERMENEIRVNGTKMPAAKFSWYLIAVMTSCKNESDFGGRNLVADMKMKLKNEFLYHGIYQHYPLHGWYGIYLAASAYCISQAESPGDYYVHKIIHSQNRDGSFDRSKSVDHTAQAMLALTCISRTSGISNSLGKKLSDSLNSASKYLKTKLTTERFNTWVGDKYSTPAALLAIKEASNWNGEEWRCELVVKSLNQRPSALDPESGLSQAMLALKGVSNLKLMDETHTCPETGTTDGETEISSQEGEVEVSCRDLESAHSNPRAIQIDIHLSSHPFAYAHGSDRNTGVTRFTLEGAAKGKTLLEMMKLAQCRGFFTFETTDSAWGEYLTTVNGTQANSEKKEYWAIENNGESLTVGIGQFKPSNGDRIAFKLKRWG